MTYLTGAHPDRESSRDRDRVDFNFASTTRQENAVVATDVAFVQPIRWIREQPKFPDCVGQTVAEIVDAFSYEGGLEIPAWASGVSIWRDARRRQGLIEMIDLGTRLEYAFESLVERGWDPYRDGEDFDDVEAGKGAPIAGDDLADEMAAFDNMQPRDIKRYRILGFGSAVLDQVDEALRRGLGVGIGTGLFDPYLSYPTRTADQKDEVLGTDYLGGNDNRHAQRIAGLGQQSNGRRMYMLQNHWGRGFAGCHGPDGGWFEGCVWVDEAVIAEANDVHVVEIR